MMVIDPDGEAFVRSLLDEYGTDVLSMANRARRQTDDDVVVLLLETASEVFISALSRRVMLEMTLSVSIPDEMIAAMAKPAGAGYFWLLCVSDEGRKVSCMRASAYTMVQGGLA